MKIAIEGYIREGKTTIAKLITNALHENGFEILINQDERRSFTQRNSESQSDAISTVKAKMAGKPIYIETVQTRRKKE